MGRKIGKEPPKLFFLMIIIVSQFNVVPKVSVSFPVGLCIELNTFKIPHFPFAQSAHYLNNN